MDKNLILIVSLLASLSGISESLVIDCSYKFNDWTHLGNIYECFVSKSCRIDSYEKSIIECIEGSHVNELNNGNVQGIRLSGGKTQFFLRGWATFFNNLTGIKINSAELEVVHQSDMRNFPKLKELDFHGNFIEILEPGLFYYNPKLEYIDLGQNLISHIDPQVFDNLPNLMTLILYPNLCKFDPSIQNVENVLVAAKRQCVNSDYSYLDEELRKLSTICRQELFDEGYKNLEKEIKNLNLFNFFIESLNGIKVVNANKSQESCKIPIINDCSSIKSEISNFATNLNSFVSKISYETKSDDRNKEDQKLEDLEKNLERLKLFANEKFNKIELELKTVQENIIRSTKAEIDQMETKLMQKLDMISKAMKIDAASDHFLKHLFH